MISASYAVDGVPFPLSPTHELAWEVGAASLAATAPPRTDIFIDPAARHEGEGVVLNAPALLGTPPEGDYQLAAHVTVDFASTADAVAWTAPASAARSCAVRTRPSTRSTRWHRSISPAGTAGSARNSGARR